MSDNETREAIEQRLDNLFDALVPPSGKCETLEGEMIRAINKIIYRHYNDGDYWFDGYGCETAGPPASFLMSGDCPIDLREEFNNSYGADGEDYEKFLWIIVEKIVAYVESRNGEYKENYVDMLDYEAKYKNEDDEEDYDEEYEDDGWDDEE